MTGARCDVAPCRLEDKMRLIASPARARTVDRRHFPLLAAGEAGTRAVVEAEAGLHASRADHSAAVTSDQAWHGADEHIHKVQHSPTVTLDDVLPEDAQSGSLAYRKVKCKSGVCPVRVGDNSMQTTVGKSQNSSEAALRIARLCFDILERGASKEQALAYRQTLYTKLQDAGFKGQDAAPARSRRSGTRSSKASASSAESTGASYDLVDCNVSASAAAGAFAPGQRVFFTGLVGRADLNGACGSLCRWEPATGRWVVALRGGDAVNVRPTNLVATPEAESARAVPARKRKTGIEGSATACKVDPMKRKTIDKSARASKEAVDVKREEAQKEGPSKLRFCVFTEAEKLELAEKVRKLIELMSQPMPMTPGEKSQEPEASTSHRRSKTEDCQTTSDFAVVDDLAPEEQPVWRHKAPSDISSQDSAVKPVKISCKAAQQPLGLHEPMSQAQQNAQPVSGEVAIVSTNLLSRLVARHGSGVLDRRQMQSPTSQAAGAPTASCVGKAAPAPATVLEASGGAGECCFGKATNVPAGDARGKRGCPSKRDVSDLSCEKERKNKRRRGAASRPLACARTTQDSNSDSSWCTLEYLFS